VGWPAGRTMEYLLSPQCLVKIKTVVIWNTHECTWMSRVTQVRAQRQCRSHFWGCFHAQTHSRTLRPIITTTTSSFGILDVGSKAAACANTLTNSSTRDNIHELCDHDSRSNDFFNSLVHVFCVILFVRSIKCWVSTCLSYNKFTGEPVKKKVSVYVRYFFFIDPRVRKIRNEVSGDLMNVSFADVFL